jgi:hypothetical protein
MASTKRFIAQFVKRRLGCNAHGVACLAFFAWGACMSECDGRKKGLVPLQIFSGFDSSFARFAYGKGGCRVQHKACLCTAQP